MYFKLFFAIGACLLILLGAGIYYRDENALRDDSNLEANKAKPYSLARVQLWWWTLVIIISFTLVYGITGQFWPMNETCLTLLGISLFTTTSGKIIDNNQITDGKTERHQDNPSEGFMTDILSDENGLSIHRFQTVVFNLVYSFYFLIEVFSQLDGKAFPVFDAQTLALLGISSSAYIALKMTEAKPKPSGAEANPLKGNTPNEVQT